MERPLGINVGISRYKATVHYTDCAYYRSSYHHHVLLPDSVKVSLCKKCCPVEEDVRCSPPAMSWNPFSHSQGPRTKIVHVDMRIAEEVAAHHDLGYGKTPKRRVV